MSHPVLIVTSGTSTAASGPSLELSTGVSSPLGARRSRRSRPIGGSGPSSRPPASRANPAGMASWQEPHRSALERRIVAVWIRRLKADLTEALAELPKGFLRVVTPLHDLG
jgi:hypothetical protein